MSPQLDSWQRDREKQGVQWDWSRRIKSSFWVSKKCFCVALGVCAWVCVGVCLTDWLGGIGWSMRWQEICSLLSTEKDWHFSTRDSFQFLNSQTYTTWMKPCSHPNITHKQTFLSHHSRKIMCVFIIAAFIVGTLIPPSLMWLIVLLDIFKKLWLFY